MRRDIGSDFHYEIIKAFEAIAPKSPHFYRIRLDLGKAPKENWKKGDVYNHAETNFAFLAFRHGAYWAEAHLREDAA